MHRYRKFSWVSYPKMTKTNTQVLKAGTIVFYPRPADSIGHSVRRPSVPPSKMSKKNQIQISQLWDLIETWGFREDLPLVFPHDPR